MTQRLPDADDCQSDQGSSKQVGTSNCDSPPAYESLESLESVTSPTPQKSTSGFEGNDRAPVQQASLYTWSNFFSHSPVLLSRFRVQNLSRENVYRAYAFNADMHVVYAFEYHRPSYCYNCIYDDMPLQGWWPWPRPRESPSPRDVGVSGLAVEPGDAFDELFTLPFPVSQREPPQPHQQPSGCIML
ncbi:hypothetical protein C8A00DRAFT_31942 [Chaetomidium leptoderma]|uniref:Uncharacterized protein n=1 Tax=Chaetomidium leptoderma TaxID=669021 RepID=A0AAN6VP79_9PEZI|nr:hypothetical protein C8A00DRAFT_31942 [Chaetomidium leptoderma]